MECKRIEEQLSAYVDKQLSSEEKVLVDEHLRACSKCSLVLEELKQTISHTENLEEIDPPAWLTQKIMAKVQEDALEKKGIVQKIFPPGMKIPLQAAATLAICVVAFVVFRTIGPELDHTQLLQEKQVATQQEIDEEVGDKEIMPASPDVKEFLLEEVIPSPKAKYRKKPSYASPPASAKKGIREEAESSRLGGAFPAKRFGSEYTDGEEKMSLNTDQETFLAEIVKFREPLKTYKAFEVLFRRLDNGEIFCSEFISDHKLFQMISIANRKFISEHPDHNKHEMKEITKALNLPGLKITAGKPYHKSCLNYDMSRNIIEWNSVEHVNSPSP